MEDCLYCIYPPLGTPGQSPNVVGVATTLAGSSPRPRDDFPRTSFTESPGGTLCRNWRFLKEILRTRVRNRLKTMGLRSWPASLSHKIYYLLFLRFVLVFNRNLSVSTGTMFVISSLRVIKAPLRTYIAL